MKRRNFIKQTGILAGAAMVAPSLMSAKKKEVKLVILHTNDTHSNIEPFAKNHAKFPDTGGVSRRAALIKNIRQQEDNVILLDAGDIFQGTPYFNKFKGVLEMKAMTEMQYDVMTLGNHDFDIGVDGFIAAKKHGSMAVVNANYELDTCALSSCVQPNVILKRGGLKIGIFGLGVDLEGLVAKENTKGVVYTDPIKAAQLQVETLQKKGCDYIICLSHLGFEYPTDKVSDKLLAAKTHGIDLIIGGHTHTFLEIPFVTQNAKGLDVLINQVGYAGLNLGRIDVTFSSEYNKTLSASTIRLTSEWDLA